MIPREPEFDKDLLNEDPADLYENAPCGYISTLPDGIIVKTNDTFLRWTGYAADQLLWTKRFQDLLPIAGKIYHDTHFGPLLLMQGHVSELAFEVTCADGGRLPVLLNSILKKDDAGTPLLIRTTLLDARQRRAYEQELLKAKREAEDAELSLRRLNDDLEAQVAIRTAERDRLWHTAQDILAISTRNGRFLRCNPAFSAVLGWSEADAQAMLFGELLHPDDAGRANQAMHQLAQGIPLKQAVHCCRHKEGGYRWLSWNVVPEGEMLYFVGRDITEEMRQAEALRAAEEALRQAQKMEAVGQLTGGLAHDFNNLLSGITGNLQLLRVRLAQRRMDSLAHYIDAAESIVAKASGLTRRMLAFARRQTLEPEVIDVNELVVSMIDLFRQTAGPGIHMDFQLSADLQLVHADRNQLENALLNLVINARDAMPDGGDIIIRSANRNSGKAGAGMPAASHVVISVTDTGVGMPPEVAERAFDPFFTTKPPGQGTGLGLSMIFGFVRQSGGDVRMESSPGHGTTVTIRLPAHAGGQTNGNEAS
jgi:PAS domain S-box-containing protein